MKNAAPRPCGFWQGRRRRKATGAISDLGGAGGCCERVPEAPPPIVDRMISTTYSAIVADYQARHGVASIT